MTRLHLDPPENARPLRCGECLPATRRGKGQCHARERMLRGLPLAPKRPVAMTHDGCPQRMRRITRHGTITLIARLDALVGKLIARTEQHHTHAG